MAEADHVETVLARASAAFAQQFGGEPKWAAFAPGRVNLIGEHTDYNEGFVLPIAIDRVCVAVAGPSRDPRVSRIWSADVAQLATGDFASPLVIKAREEASGPGLERGSWLSYIFGIVAQFQSSCRVPNLDMAIASAVPLGSGLSSSASVEVAVATLVEQVVGTKLEPRAKALLCQRAEHEFAGVPCGIMDQLVSVMGRQGHALMIDCRDNEISHVPIPDNVSIVIANSRVRHALATGEYAARRTACAAAAAKLGIGSLRDASIADLDRAGLTHEERRCAKHVVTENARTIAAVEALKAGDLERFGRLMNESHASLRDDYQVSCSELDSLAAIASATHGVFGARMTGAGFGGCIVALVESGATAGLVAALKHGYRDRHSMDCDAFVTRASDGARSIPS